MTQRLFDSLAFIEWESYTMLESLELEFNVSFARKAWSEQIDFHHALILLAPHSCK